MDLIESNEVQALCKADMSQPEENVGISDNMRRSLCSAASKIYKEDTGCDNPDKILIRKVSQSV